MSRAVAAALAAAFAAAGCATMPPAQAPVDSTDSCRILSSSDWTAWVDAMPGPDRQPKLIVTGKVQAPSGGYSFAWRDLRVMESYPTQIVAELEVLPPDGPASQAIVTHDLRGEWPASPPVGSVSIRCGQQMLARIAPVETAR